MSAIFFFKMMHDRQKRKEHQGQRYLSLNDFKKGKRRSMVKRSINSLKTFFSSKKDIKSRS